MDKASKVLRRSGVKLKSISSGHQELNMVISELRDLRSTAKAFAVAQNTAAQDMLKWSLGEENPAIQDTFVQLAELNSLWTEVQKKFTDHLKEFIAHFAIILEGEHRLDQARTLVTAFEMKTAKIKRELRKANRRGSMGETEQLGIKLAQAENSYVQAQEEVLCQIQENEAVKLIRIKEGLLKLSDSYLELAHKCCIIYEAHRDVARQIPDVHSNYLHEMRYTGPELAKEAVLRAKEGVSAYSQHAPNITPYAPVLVDPPPPYSPTNHTDNAPFNPYYTSHSSLPQVHCVGPVGENSNPFHFSPQCSGSHRSLGFSGHGSTTETSGFNSPNRNPFQEDDSNRLSDSCTPMLNLRANHDVERHTDYEEDLAGAVGRIKT